MENLSYTFVTGLEEAESALTSDVFLISLLSDGSLQYISKKLPYSKLCSLILVDVDGKIDDRLNDVIGQLSTQVSINTSDIRYLSAQVDDCITAIVKIANCVLVNKSNISSLSSIVSANMLSNLHFVNGLSSYKVGNQISVGHDAKKVGSKNAGLYKVGFDNYGHISSSAAVTKADITALGIPGQDTNTTYGPATTTTLGLVKLNAGEYSNNDRFKLLLDSSNNAYVDVPVHEILDTELGVASEDHLGLVALCSTIKTIWKNDPILSSLADYIYPLKIYKDKYAYVKVDSSGGSSGGGGSGTLAVDESATISSIAYANGSIIQVGRSYYLYNAISGVSSDYYLSGLWNGNTELTVTNGDDGSKWLELVRGDETVSKVNAANLIDVTVNKVDIEVVKSYPSDGTTLTKPALKITNVGSIVSYSDIPYEDWTFTLDNGSTTKRRVFCYSI